MPVVCVHTRRGRTAAQKRALLDATHHALVATLRIPDTDRHQRIQEYDPEDFEIPPGRGSGYLFVEITMLAGRTPATRRALHRALVDELAAAGVPADDVLIALHEVPLENWGLRGGHAASDIDLGFQVEV